MSLSKKKYSKRFIWADVMRIFAICFVVLVHNLTYPTNLQISSILLLLLLAIAKTGVPLFIMLSGALLLGKKESNGEFFRKRIKRLLLPWLFWSAVIFIFRNFSELSTSSRISIASEYKQILFTDFWFLPLIICLYLITPFLRYFTISAKRNDFFLLLGLWISAVSIIPFLRPSEAFPLHTDNGLLRQTILFTGYYILGYVILIKNKVSLLKICVATLIGTCGIVFLTLSQSSSKLDLRFVDYLSPFIILLSGGIAIIMQRLSEKITINRFIREKIIYTMSRASYGVLFVHLIIISIITQFFPNSLISNSSFVQYIFVLTISFLIIVTLKKIPYFGNFIA